MAALAWPLWTTAAPPPRPCWRTSLGLSRERVLAYPETTAERAAGRCLRTAAGARRRRRAAGLPHRPARVLRAGIRGRCPRAGAAPGDRAVGGPGPRNGRIPHPRRGHRLGLHHRRPGRAPARRHVHRRRHFARRPGRRPPQRRQAWPFRPITLSWKATCCQPSLDPAARALRDDGHSSRPRPFDLITANLPYIDRAELARLPVSRYEPRVALDGGPGGLRLIERLLRQAPACLGPARNAAAGNRRPARAGRRWPWRGRVFPSASITVKPDLAGLDRVLVVQLAAPPAG